MAGTSEHAPVVSKVYYRPIEAAIRWSGLVRHEQQILAVLQARNVPEPGDFPEWPSLRLNAERICDGIRNGELRCRLKGGPSSNDASDIDRPDLTIRHVDLRSWMTHYYPDQRPRFLFSRIERCAPTSLTFQTVHALLVERDALSTELKHCQREIRVLRAQIKQSQTLSTVESVGESLSSRAEMTYLHIVGGLLTLLLGRTPSGQPYSSFQTQQSIISAMIAHHGNKLGIAERTLQAKFAAARRALDRS